LNRLDRNPSLPFPNTDTHTEVLASSGAVRVRESAPKARPSSGLSWTAVLIAGFVAGCDKEIKTESFVPNTGQIQILNGCGKPGAAESFRNYLTDQGFDIIEFGNAASWNYAQTIVVARTANEPVARDLAKVLNTENLIHLFDPLAMVDATVFIGKDYEELIKRWQRPKQ
jgi:hypothetical protein